MKVNSTELQNNFGKYLMLAAREDTIITRNGMEIAKPTAMGNGLTEHSSAPGAVGAKAEEYSYEGRKASYEEFLELNGNSEESDLPIKAISKGNAGMVFWSNT